MNALKTTLLWGGIAVATAPVWGTFVWEVWEYGIRPRLIPRAEIDALSAATLTRHGDKAEEIASIEEDRAWCHSNSFERGKWRRVRKRIEEMRRDPPSAVCVAARRMPARSCQNTFR